VPGDDGIGLEGQRLDDLVGLLPFIALRIVEHVRPLLRAAEAVLMRGG